MLLGKNGSGKSRFLKGLTALGDKQQINPQIILRFSIPSLEEHLEYLETKESVRQTEEFVFAKENAMRGWDREGHNYEKDIFNLPFHNALIEALVIPILNHSFRRQFGVETGQDVLKLFGLSESEIDAFNKRCIDYGIEFEYFGPGYEELQAGPRANLNFRDYFAEFLLALLRVSDVYTEDYSSFYFFNCSEWLTDAKNRNSLVKCLRGLFENANFVDVAIENEQVSFSLVGQNEETSQFRQLLESINKPSDEYGDRSFPFDLFRDETDLFSSWLTLTLNQKTFTPFFIKDLTFQKREDSITKLQNLFREYIEIELAIDESYEYDYQLNVSGLKNLDELLQDVNLLLSTVDIGVSELRIQTIGTMPFGTIRSLPIQSHNFQPVIEWLDSNSQSWLELSACSDGQLEVVRLLISLCIFATFDKTGTTIFLLIDEFDRHLHPVISQQMLDCFDRFGKEKGIHLIISTHSIASLELHRHTQLFAERDINGLHHLSTERHDDQIVLAHILGVPELDTRKLKKLFVVVEGDHEMIIFKHLIASYSDSASVEFFNLNGLRGLSNFWRSYLQFETTGVLLVYDKRNIALESEWMKVQQLTSKARVTEDLWTKYPTINSMLTELYKRKSLNQRRSGDTELLQIAFLIKEVLKPARQLVNIKRLHLHGVEVPDIVDCLPISAFPKASSFGSWTKLRSGNADMFPDKFKREFGITNSSVEKAAKTSLNDPLHPELQRLDARIRGIIDVPSDWPIN